MGFPVAYTDIFIPPLFLHTLTFFTHLHNLLFSLFPSLPVPDSTTSSASTSNPPFSASLIKELLPLVKLPDDVEEAQKYCSVCLYEVHKDEVIRWLDNCKHVFHKDCLERWIDLDHRTCPLCRTMLLRDDLVHEFNRRLKSYDDVRRYDVCSDLALYIDDCYN